ncbi:dolichyldiphosphatase 1 isoform X2 [Sciurus carolinensis]|uniref:dolichyldiphosphatase 1 isoform X2 n=1 Tax=Sciurus carolinensis TaxID=30640 RepID=UPI001FB31624|nr:dolichyldiphosphatase 1 isoform X2 [Sciurus carolinensis]
MAADGQCSLPASWRPVTLTHVEYPAGDLSGHLLAYLSLSPVFVIVGFVTLIIFKRELHTISFLGGLALNEGLNWLIKHLIQEPRPCGGPHTAVGTKYGMPSSHSQFMWFFSVYSFLFLYLRMHQTNNARFLDLLWRHVLSLGLLTAAFLVSYSRPVSEFFLIRDTSLIPNVLWFEYTVTRAEARFLRPWRPRCPTVHPCLIPSSVRRYFLDAHSPWGNCWPAAPGHLPWFLGKRERGGGLPQDEHWVTAVSRLTA